MKSTPKTGGNGQNEGCSLERVTSRNLELFAGHLDVFLDLHRLDDGPGAPTSDLYEKEDMIPAGKRGYSFFLRGLERLAVPSRDHHIGQLPGVSLFLTLCRGCVPVISQFSTSEGFSTLEDFFCAGTTLRKRVQKDFM